MPSPLAVRVGSHTLDATPSLTHTGSAQAPSDQRREKIPNRPSTRPCQATCRLPSGWANTSWLNEGPSVVLTGSGSLQEPSENRQAQTPTRPSTDRPNSSQGVPSAVTAAVGRNRSSGPSTDRRRPPVQRGDEPVAAPLLPLQPADQRRGPPRSDAGSGGVAAAGQHRGRAAGLPDEPGRGVQDGRGLLELGRDLPVALVHPHVPQGVRFQRGDGAGDVDALLDRDGQPMVERQHQVEVGLLAFGVLAAVVVGGATVRVPVGVR